MARDQAYSFTYESPVTGEDQQGQSPTLTSSFSSFLVNDNTPLSASEGPRIAVEKGDFLFDARVTDLKLDAIHGEVFLGKFPALSDTLVPVNRGIGERMQKIEIPQEGFNGSILSSIHGRRNHTIGPGELDQLNVMVSESVIRWAACSHIPTAPSLRLSLVC
ncbi:hypothetical protein NC651_001183 [Populus alba x Populus x berolinensis]|nr:hypothetical protein NC651_001183 [Populus alba x Populus x berolinensis]